MDPFRGAPADDARENPGYTTDMSERRSRILTPLPPRRRSNPVATTLLVLLGMAVMGAGGFFLGREVLAKKMLKPTEVRSPRPDPIRILTPEEARAIARDEASPVWTEGVNKEDIPELEQPESRRPRRRTHRENTTTPARTTETPTPSTTPDAAPVTPETTPTPVDDAEPNDADGALD